MAHLSFYTGDATASTWENDFSALVMRPPLPGAEITFWNMLSKSADGKEPTKFEWVEEEQTQHTLELGEALDTTETDIQFAAGEIAGAGLRAGAVLRNVTDSTTTEVILVSSVDSVTNATVVRDYGGNVSGSGGGTTGQTHDSGDKLQIVGYLNYEGSSVTKTAYFAKRDRALQYNYYSLVDDWTQITGSDMVRVYRGNYPDNWTYQVDGLVTRLERQMEEHCFIMPRVARAAGAAGSMGGLLWWIKNTTGDHDPTAAINFNYEAVDDGLLYLHERCGLDDIDPVLIVPRAGAQSAAYIHESAFTGDYATEGTRGLMARQFMSTLTGKKVPIIVAAHMPSDAFLILNKAAVRIHFLQGRGLKVYTKGLGEQLDDYKGQRWISELTMEFQRPADNCYYHTSVTYGRPS